MSLVSLFCLDLDSIGSYHHGVHVTNHGKLRMYLGFLYGKRTILLFSYPPVIAPILLSDKIITLEELVCCHAAAAKSLHSCDPVRPHRQQPTSLPCPWDSPGKNTGVGCHFLLQCRKVKSESEVAQLCLTRSDPMDCSLPGSSVHGIFKARVLEWVAIAFSSCQASIL